MSEATKPKKRKKVYCLRVRPDDQSEWSEADVYLLKKYRDHDEKIARCVGGYRTHSFEKYEE